MWPLSLKNLVGKYVNVWPALTGWRVKKTNREPAHFLHFRCQPSSWAVSVISFQAAPKFTRRAPTWRHTKGRTQVRNHFSVALTWCWCVLCWCFPWSRQWPSALWLCESRVDEARCKCRTVSFAPTGEPTSLKHKYKHHSQCVYTRNIMREILSVCFCRACVSGKETFLATN